MQGPEHDLDLLKNGLYGYVTTVWVKVFFCRSLTFFIRYQSLRRLLPTNQYVADLKPRSVIEHRLTKSQ
jgi:hypothetical protein